MSSKLYGILLELTGKCFSESPDNEVPFNINVYSPCFIIYGITYKNPTGKIPLSRIIIHHEIPINS